MDIYTGALSEPPMDGAIVGPLLSCIITDQFLRLKRGDSHWYERHIGPQSFTRGNFVGIYNTIEMNGDHSCILLFDLF